MTIQQLQQFKKMKHLLIVLTLAVAGMMLPNQAQAQQDAIEKYFEKYMDDENFTVVYISSKMFDLFARIETDDEDYEDMKEVIKDLRGIRILVRENGGNKFYEEAISMINFKEYDELMTVRDEETNVKFVIKDNGDVIEELLLVVGGDDEFVLMSLIGKIDLAKISRIAQDIDGVDGLEHLEKLGDKDDDDEDKDNDE